MVFLEIAVTVTTPTPFPPMLSIRKLFANLAWLPEIKREWTSAICESRTLEAIG